MPCIAIKVDGHECNKNTREGEERCGMHTAQRIRNGPNATQIAGIKAVYKKDNNQIYDGFNQSIELLRQQFQGNEYHTRYNAAYRNMTLRMRALRTNYMETINETIQHHAELIRITGVDPDAEANARRAAVRAQRRANVERNRQDEVAWAARIREDARQAGRDVRIAPAPVVGNLAAFANDNQNVHTTSAVNQTKKIVERILKIPVPPEYRWNTIECSKTPGEIILECKVSPTATWQMMAKYCQADDVYELGAGIYGRVLDCVWQYIKNSEHKEDLYKILKTEMQDNIGMCAQGNLSRLTNIVAGYMEGIGPQESVAQILGRLLPPLMEIEDEEERLSKAIKIRDEYAVLDNDRQSWLEALA